MPKRDEELEYDFDDEEEAEDEYEEDEDGYDYDDEEDEEEEGGSGWARKALVAGIAVLAIGGGGTYAYLQGMLPFSPQSPVSTAASTSPFANPNGFGHLHHASSSLPPMSQVLSKATKSAAIAQSTPAAKAVTAKSKNATSLESKVAAKPKIEASPETKVAAKPVHPLMVAKAPLVKHPFKPLAKPVRHAVVAHRPVSKPIRVAVKVSAAGGFGVQCGAFENLSNAQNLSKVLDAKGFRSWVSNGSSTSAGAFAIRSTVVNSMAKANALKVKFAQAGHPGSIVPAGPGRYMLQLGVFSSWNGAKALANEVKSKGLFVSVAGGRAKLRTTNRVYVGKFGSLTQAQQEAAKIRQHGIPAIPVRL